MNCQVAACILNDTKKITLFETTVLLTVQSLYQQYFYENFFMATAIFTMATLILIITMVMIKAQKRVR